MAVITPRRKAGLFDAVNPVRDFMRRYSEMNYLEIPDS